MSILSDAEIKDYLQKGELIVGGDPQYARGCSYCFRAGKVFTGGDDGTVTDWTNGRPHRAFLIKPGAMIWIRIREQVKLPIDVTAAWWQTNGLSRQGIMLVNMSVVDPGYQGPLACLFVNFGNTTVPIDENTVVARLLFDKSAVPVGAPYIASGDLAKYDSELHARALAGASSFMRVAELTTDLGRQKQALFDDLKEEKNRILKTIEDNIKEDAPKWMKRTFLWAGLGFLVLVTAVNFVPYLQGFIQPDLNGKIQEVGRNSGPPTSSPW